MRTVIAVTMSAGIFFTSSPEACGQAFRGEFRGAGVQQASQPQTTLTQPSFEAQQFQAPAQAPSNALQPILDETDTDSFRRRGNWQPPQLQTEAQPEASFDNPSGTEFGNWPSNSQGANGERIHVDHSVLPSNLEVELPGNEPPPRLASGSPTAPPRLEDRIPARDLLTAPPTSVPAFNGTLTDGFSATPSLEAELSPIESADRTDSTTMSQFSAWFETAKQKATDWFQSTAGASSSSGPGGLDLQKILGSLAVVLGGYFALVWISRLVNPRSSRSLPAEVVNIVGQLPYGQGKQLQLVRLGSKLVLLLNGPTGTSPLGEITDTDEVEYLSSLCKGSRGALAKLFRRSGNESTQRQVTERRRVRESRTNTRQSSSTPVTIPATRPAEIDQLVERLADAIRSRGNEFEA